LQRTPKLTYGADNEAREGERKNDATTDADGYGPDRVNAELC
jgi:hypothetical protein